LMDALSFCVPIVCQLCLGKALLQLSRALLGRKKK
jgi:hypothetical protein